MTDAAPPPQPPVVRCVTCGTPYPWEQARYCIQCKTFRNPFHEWMANFNANGWTTLLAVTALTVSSVASVYNRFADHVSIYPSACHARQMIATVVNGEPQGSILSDPRAEVSFNGPSGPQSVSMPAGKLLASSKIPDLSADHLDSDFVPALHQAYLSISIRDVAFPLLPPAAKDCKVLFSVAYAYGPLVVHKRKSIGGCPCGVIIG